MGRRVSPTLLAATLAASVLWIAAPRASATNLNFTLINAGSNQSRLDLTATAELAGGQLTSDPQFAPGGLNGQGSMSTLYNDTTVPDTSIVKANVTQNSISFPGGSTAIARTATGLLGNNLSIGPGVGGVSGTAPANYGVVFSSPQNIAIPPIDLNPIGVPLMLNLGTLQSIDAKIALRNVVVDVVGGSIPLTPGATYPQSFDASQVQIGISGTSDILLGATLKQSSFGDYLAAGIALAALQPVLAGQGIALTIVNNGIIAQSYTVGFGFTTPLPATLAVNDDATLGTVEHVGPNMRLTIPVKFDIVPETLPAPLDMLLVAHLGLSGKLVGETPFVVVDVPEPSSLVLGGLAMGGLGLAAARRVRRRIG
jgi:hypothetical protein